MDERDIYADSQPVEATDREVKEIGILATRAIRLSEEIAAMQAQVDELKKQHFQLVEKDLPEAMDAANCGSFTHKETGKKISVKDEIRASISKPNQPEAHAWLRANNHDDLIKNQIVVPLGRGLDNVAKQIIKDLRDKFDIEAEQSESVHASTLSAFCREQLGKGVELPGPILGLHIRRVAVIK